MSIKKLVTLIICALLINLAQTATAQSPNKIFHGAEATLSNYKALYILNDGNEKKIRATFKNIKNVLEDTRLKGKLEIELIVFGDAVQVYAKDGPYAEIVEDLHLKGVILAQCENTIRERKINKTTLLSFISYVPSAAGEIIIRQYQGWAIVHP